MPEGTGRGARPLISERLGRDVGGREADSIAKRGWRIWRGLSGRERGRDSKRAVKSDPEMYERTSRDVNHGNARSQKV